MTTFTTNVWLWLSGQPDKKMSVVQLKTILIKINKDLLLFDP